MTGDRGGELPLFVKEGAVAKPGGVAGSKTSQYAELT